MSVIKSVTYILIVIGLALAPAVSKKIDAGYQLQASLNVEEAKSRLEQLERELLKVEAQARAEIERTVTKQVNIAPKGEFETTKEYEARKAQAAKLRQQKEERVNQKKEARREDLNRRINEILTLEFTLPFEAYLGTYDADAQKFPLTIPGDSQASLFVPRPEARELKENFSSAEKTGVFGLHLDSENRATTYLLSGEIRFRGRTYRVDNKGMSVERAMFMLYGNYSPSKNRARWKGEPPAWDETSEVLSLEALPVFSKQFRENNANKFVVVTGSVNEGDKEFDGCHGCGVKMGIVVVAEKDGKWVIEAGQKDVGTHGSWGQPPDVGLVKIGMDRYALTFSWGWLGQGITMEGIYYLDRVTGVFKEVLSIRTAEDTTGAGQLSTIEDNVSYNSKIEYISGTHPIYFDIRVTTQGKRGTKVGRRMVMRPFTEVKLFKFANGIYRPS